MRSIGGGYWPAVLRAWSVWRGAGLWLDARRRSRPVARMIRR